MFKVTQHVVSTAYDLDGLRFYTKLEIIPHTRQYKLTTSLMNPDDIGNGHPCDAWALINESVRELKYAMTRRDFKEVGSSTSEDTVAFECITNTLDTAQPFYFEEKHLDK